MAMKGEIAYNKIMLQRFGFLTDSKDFFIGLSYYYSFIGVA